MLRDHRKFVAWLAWALCLSCVGLALCAPLLWVLNGKTLIGFVREGDGAVVVLVISFSVVGALIVSHRPENTIGWIFCVAALCQAISELGLEYDVVDLDTLRGDLVTVVQETLQPAQVSLWLRLPDSAGRGLEAEERNR